jgi:catalase-peroxidase
VVLINGGSDGGRIRLAPQKDWQVNNPSQLAKVLDTLQSIQTKFNTAQSTGKLVSIADLVVLAGCAAIEKSNKRWSYSNRSFTPGRTDASQEQTDVESFAVLEAEAGFRNYTKTSIQYLQRKC